MLRVPISQIVPGITLALPVFNPGAVGRVLLKPGFKLDEATINRLIQFRVSDVWIRYPGLEAVDKFVKPELVQQQQKLVREINHAFETASSAAAPRLDLHSYIRTVGELVNELLANPATALFLDEIGETDAPLQSHCMRVAYLSILMGLKLDAYLVQKRKRLSPIKAQEVTSLGVGAMLHDIGIARLPAEVRAKFEQTGDADDPRWQQHPRLGYDLVGDQVQPSARAVILHHHQRYDGAGFPAQEDLNGELTAPAGEQIHVFARIAALANKFDRLIHPVSEGRKPPVAALDELLHTPLRNQFDPQVIDALIKIAPPYPPGTLVTLNDGRRAAALEHNPADPCRPKVHILSDGPDAPLLGEDGSEAPLNLIDLSEHSEVRIVKADGFDVDEHNFDPPRLTSAA